MDRSDRFRPGTQTILLAFLAALAGLGWTGVGPADGEQEEPASVAALLTELDELAPDAGQVARVEGLRIERPNATFVLESGQLTLTEPILGRSAGAVFVGSGRFLFTPKDGVEQGQLERFFEARELDQELESVVFFFSDSTLTELQAALDFVPGTFGSADDEVRDVLELMLDADKGYVDEAFARALLNQGEPELFDAHVEPRRGDRLRYRWNAGDEEPVELARKVGRKGRDGYEVISRFAPAGHSGADNLQDRIEHYDLSVSFDDDLDVMATASLVLRPASRGGDGRWIPFRLHSGLGVRAVTWQGIGEALHFRGKETSLLWVFAPPEVATSSSAILQVTYGGELISSRYGLYWLQSPTGWYPSTGDVNATFALAFDVPEKYAFVGSGKLLLQETSDKRVRTRWLVEEPWVHASFNLGEFEEYTYVDKQDRSPPVRLQVAERAHNRIRTEFADAGYFLLEQENMEEQVGQDIALSLNFFNHHFGPLAVDTFYVTEIWASHGQAFAGMIQLSWQTYQWTSDSGTDESFRAHEVAHQWWGGAVQPHSYRDVWLSEGLAEYSGLWYMQQIRSNPQLYVKQLDEYRENILERRGESGPISLGWRLYTSDTEEDYRIITYEKGAWIVHMLRHLMRNPDAGGDDIFVGMLKDLHTSFKGRRVRTQDFQDLVTRHAGVDMGWFFDQWVHGTDVPTYRFAWTGEETATGEYRARVRVRQENVSDDFQMIVPLLLDFGADGWAPVRILVKGPVTEVELPILPRKPDEILFNDGDAVLAEVRKEGW